MKLKDIEKKLKNENSEVKVPDVCDRAQKAPINRLLSPVRHVFEKKLAIKILGVCFILLIMAIFTGITMWALPNSESSAVYLNVSYTKDGIIIQEGYVVRGEDIIFGCVESVDGQYEYTRLSIDTSDICQLMIERFEDSGVNGIDLSIISSDNSERDRVFKAVDSTLKSIGGINVFNKTSQVAKDALKVALDGSVEFDDNNIEKMIIEYTKVCD